MYKRQVFTFLKNALALCGCLLCIALYFIYNTASKDGVTAGLLLCAQTVIPSLFPFMIITQLIIENETCYILGLLFLPYTRLLKIKSKKAACGVLLSLLGGFAVAARTLCSLYESGDITKRDAEVLLCCCVGSAPSFVISAVGGGIAGSLSIGVLMFAALTAASLLSGILFGLIMREKGALNADLTPKAAEKGGIINAVRSSVTAMLYICGYVVFFSFLIEILTQNDALKSYSGIIAAALEPTSACRILKEPLKCCVALSICGLSIVFQVRTLLNKSLSLAPFVLSRAVHLPVTIIVFKLLLRALPIYASTAVITVFSQKVYTRLPADTITSIFVLLCFVFYFAPKRHFTIREK